MKGRCGCFRGSVRKRSKSIAHPRLTVPVSPASLCPSSLPSRSSLLPLFLSSFFFLHSFLKWISLCSPGWCQLTALQTQPPDDHNYKTLQPCLVQKVECQNKTNTNRQYNTILFHVLVWVSIARGTCSALFLNLVKTSRKSGLNKNVPSRILSFPTTN